MTFLHLAFLGGTLAVVVPIALHLLMRQQPKHLEFPALRFIAAQASANRRQMRLRHWLLLALRCALVALLAIALARPSVVSSGMLGDSEAPVAAALVFDTNPRMQYRQQNKTRLEVAQETAVGLLPQLPAESEVAVIDSRFSTAAFAVDASAAADRIRRLDATTAAQPLGEAITAALALLRESDKPRKEIYVFTDLARTAWTGDAMRELTRTLPSHLGVGIYLIDVGVSDPTNFGISQPQLPLQVLSKNSPLVLRCELEHRGDAGERSVELYLVDRQTGETSVRQQQVFQFGPNETLRGEFRIGSLPSGVHQGYVKLSGQDALAVDDQRWFTVEVRPAWKVLIAAPRDAQRTAEEYGLFVAQALAPDAMRLKGQAAFDCSVISLDSLASAPLDSYAAVCLVDPTPLPDATWQKLNGYVAGGGGLGVFLGRNAVPLDRFNTPLALELLPGKLVRQWRSDSGVYLGLDGSEHPLLARFKRGGLAVPWEAFPVFRHWQFAQLAEGTGVVLRYSNGQPALLERAHGKGKVLLSTTPLSDPANRADTWNLLPTGEEPWPFVMLVNEMFYYLAGSGQDQLNYTAGETAVVNLDSRPKHATYALTTPRGDQLRTPADERAGAIVITSTEAPGNYRLQAGGDVGVDLGFSVNLPTDISRLERAEKDDLAQTFGDVPYRIARNRDEIDRTVSAGRVGRELFPMLIVLLAIVLGLEQVIANRFYKDYDSAPKRSAASQWAKAPMPQPPKSKQPPMRVR